MPTANWIDFAENIISAKRKINTHVRISTLIIVISPANRIDFAENMISAKRKINAHT